MIDFDDVTKENRKEHNPSWPHIPNNFKSMQNINNWRLLIWKSKFII